MIVKFSLQTLAVFVICCIMNSPSVNGFECYALISDMIYLWLILTAALFLYEHKSEYVAAY
jgi:hypothetical protein